MHPTSIFEAGHQLQIITLWDSIVQEYRHSHVSIEDTNIVILRQRLEKPILLSKASADCSKHKLLPLHHHRRYGSMP